MKLSHLQQIVPYLQRFSHISTIYRTDDTTLKIIFEGERSIYANMQKGRSYLAMCRHDVRRTKRYQAPFDVVLAKRFGRAQITRIALYNDDKILQIEVKQQGAYKLSKTLLQLEFTGKTTNAIILDEASIVLEALRHVDAEASYRMVRTGYELLPPPPPDYTAKAYPLDDVEVYLYDVCDTVQHQRLTALKKQKISQLQKKQHKLQSRLDALEPEAALEAESVQMQHLGNLALSNMHRIKPYQATVSLEDYDGTVHAVALPELFASAHQVSDYLFRHARRLKQKAAHLHIEREGLEGKIDHLRHFIATVEGAETVEAIALLFPAKQASRQKQTHDAVETFWVDGYKVQLGKNERGNVTLLQNARARDIWLHLKGRPSTHVIITTDKQKVPPSVIETAARLCVDFSVFGAGDYEVDYTPRREVKIQEGANVLYNRYETVMISKK